MRVMPFATLLATVLAVVPPPVQHNGPPIRGGDGAPAHVLVLPGIAGAYGTTHRLARLLNEELIDVTAEVWDWTTIDRTHILGDLWDLKRNLRRAQVLADALVAWRVEHPTTKLSLVAHSGGCGIVLFACQRLPEDFEIERVVLVSPALSPGADLAPILRRARRGLFHYMSSGDFLILGAGTVLCGTTDRRHVPSAGLCGFHPPRDPALAGKLEQFRWRWSMIREGNFGGHHSGMSAAFIRTHLVPLFRP